MVSSASDLAIDAINPGVVCYNFSSPSEYFQCTDIFLGCTKTGLTLVRVGEQFGEQFQILIIIKL